jgi:hypothetical protein
MAYHALNTVPGESIDDLLRIRSLPHRQCGEAGVAARVFRNEGIVYRALGGKSNVRIVLSDRFMSRLIAIGPRPLRWRWKISIFSASVRLSRLEGSVTCPMTGTANGRL